MINVLISGAAGRMGHFVADCVAARDDMRVIAGVDAVKGDLKFPVYPDFSSLTVKPDVIIDFSNISVLDGLLEYATKNSIPTVIATTGYDDKQIDKIRVAAEKIPVFFSFNMSLGINLLCSLAKQAAALLGGDYDIEIVEKHHNKKLDAPSGTAIMLANAVNGQFGDTYQYEYDRHSKRMARPKNEIGIHSIRGGTIVGEHDVIFAGRDEVITLSHHAASREVFATGAVKAAAYICGKPAGIYDMSNVVGL